MQPKRKHYFARIPTIALFVLFALSPWLAILLFILKAIDKDAEKRERAQDAYTADFRARDTRSSAAASADPEYVYGHDTPTEEQQKAKRRHQTVTSLCTVFGGLFLAVGVFGLISSGFAADWHSVLTALAQVVGGGGALGLGLHMKSARRLERQLDKIVGDRDNIALDELFAAAGIDKARGRSTLESAIEHGYFGADAYIDNRTDTLVVRGPAPAPARPEPEPKSQPKTTAERYRQMLEQLRRANDAIPDPVMSAKISRLENVSARIFELAEKDPAKEPQLKKFMDYYLPTALKLLNTYAQLAAQDIEGQNIAEAKRSIEHSMDMLVTAFENQLDKLFQSDALDVTADAAALEGMLNLDGLAGSDFKK